MTDEGQTTRTAHGGDSAADQPPSHELALIVVAHPQPERLQQRVALPIGHTLELGRDSALLGIGQSAQISRRHARVARSASGVVIEDLGSRNGTYVDGERVTHREIARGSVIGIGEVLLLLGKIDRGSAPRLDDALVAVSPEMLEVLGRVRHVAERDTTVLLQGPSGSGKDVIARAIHEQSARRGELVALNCAGVADGIVHSELFGHTRGAFSGAERERAGLVARAQGGTLFLDEVGDASPALQASLLRLLEVREYRRVGSDLVQSTDARFLSATHVPLHDAVERGAFREDLYNRLARWVIEIPRLAERPEDVVPLACALARKWSKQVRFSPELTLALLRHRFDGNVRELDAIVEIAIAEAPGNEVGLTPGVRARMAAVERRAELRVSEPPELDRAALERALFEAGGNAQRSADRLGISRATLYRWLERFGIDAAAIRRASRRRR